MSRSAPLGAVLVSLVLLAAAGCRGRPAHPPPQGAILLVVDALRADRLGCYGYQRRPTSPHIDALAADGTRFVHAISSTPWTLPSIATLFTSLYPTVHGATLASNITQWLVDHANFRPVTVLDSSRTTLAEVLEAHAFATAGFVHGSYPAAEFGVAQGFERYDANLQPGIRFQIQALLDWLDRERPRRFFAYLHTAEVHSPYMPPGPNPRWSVDDPDPTVRDVARGLDEERARYREFDFDPDYDGSLDGSWESLRTLNARKLTPRDTEHLGALYDRGIAYTDYWIGRLVDELQRRGLYDRTVLVVTADHGDELLDHGRVEHGRTHFEEVMRVPLVIHVQDEGIGRVVDQQVGLIDVTPTLLDLLGVPSDLPFEGRSLVPLIEGKSLPEVAILGEASLTSGLKALRTNRWKYLQGGPEREQLYDLAADPGERTNVCANQKDTCAALARQLRDKEATLAEAARQAGLPEPQPAKVDAEMRERLRRLGYAN